MSAVRIRNCNVQNSICELEQAIDTYRYDGSFHVEPVVQPSANAVDFALRINTPPSLHAWSLIVGDCVHNVPAAPDQLAWLVDAAPKKGPGGTT